MNLKLAILRANLRNGSRATAAAKRDPRMEVALQRVRQAKGGMFHVEQPARGTR